MRRRQNDPDNGDGYGVGGRDGEGVEEGIGGLIRQKMLPDGSLIFPGQKAKPVGYVPVLYCIADIDEKPADQHHNYNAGRNLRSPLNDEDIPPDGNAVAG